MELRKNKVEIRKKLPMMKAALTQMTLTRRERGKPRAVRKASKAPLTWAMKAVCQNTKISLKWSTLRKRAREASQRGRTSCLIKHCLKGNR